MNSSLQEILAAWRAEQDGAAAQGDRVRYVIESGAPPERLREAVAGVLSLRFELAPLFEDADESLPFLRLDIPGLRRPDRADLFEVAAALRSATGATTVEPDVGSGYYQQSAPPESGNESINWTFWCWAKELPQDADWAIKRIRAADAWEYSKQQQRPSGGQDVLVFQPDTGVVPAHTALPKGIADDPRSANFVEPGQKPIDPLRSGANKAHGTGTGSTVIGVNSMRGAAPAAKLIPVRCIETVAVFDQSPVAQAIDHARRQGAHVITMSLGGVPSRALHAAVKKAVEQNVIVLAAAGNCVGEVVWPARYAETIALGGTNDRDKPWRGSCRGDSVAVSAPGEFVQRADGNDTAQPPARVSGGQGTSFATALTAGVAALWLAHHGRAAVLQGLPPGRSLQQNFRALLRDSASKPAGFDHQRYGAGIVDALELLKRPPIAAGAPEAAAVAANEERSLRELLQAAFGEIGAEAADPALADPQHHVELACIALDRLQLQASPQGATESPKPPAMSPQLRRAIVGPLSAEPQP